MKVLQNMIRACQTFIPVNSGMRQGFVLTSVPFNTCIDWILATSTIQSHCGAILGNIKVSDLDFADNDDILSESVETPVASLEAFSPISRIWGPAGRTCTVSIYMLVARILKSHRPLYCLICFLEVKSGCYPVP